MSKFWQEDSSSEEEQNVENDSDDEQQPVIGGRVAASEKRFATAFIDDSDSDSGDEVRVVKSQKQRAFESITETINKLKNAKKNGDWPLIQDEFNNANKQIDKSKVLILQHGIPPAYIKMLAEVEDLVQATLKDKEAVKKMKPVVAKSLNQMKLQIKKHNENYKTEIADFRANPDKYEEVEESDSSSDESDQDSDSDDDSDKDSDSDDSDKDSDSDDSVPPAKAAAVATKPNATAAVEEDSDEDSLFDRAGDDDDSSSDEEGDGRQVLTGRARWLKKPGADTKAKAKVEDPFAAKKPKENKPKLLKPKVDVTVAANAAASLAWSVVDTMTVEDLDKRVAEIVASRGRKTTETKDALRQMEVLSKIGRRHGAAKELPILMHLISLRLETVRSIDDYLEHAAWSATNRNIARVMTLLESQSDLLLTALGAEDPAELSLSFIKPDQIEQTNENVIRVVGSIESFVSRLADEYTKAVQQINPHTSEYVARLADEAALVELQRRAFAYYQRINDKRAAASLALMIVEHIYYKHETHAASVDQAHAFNKRWGNYVDLHPASKGRTQTAVDVKVRHPASFSGPPTVKAEVVDYAVLLEELCAFVFKQADVAVQKTRALLCLVYHHALHDRFHAARDLFLLSHVHDFIEKAEVRTQVLYNRALAMLGLAAFRLGLYQKAHDLLSPLCSNARWKELLAQGTQRVNNNDPQRDLVAEKEERRRQLPYHMHVNPELLEAAHLSCAMLLELPQLARLNTSAGIGSVNILAQPGIISKGLRKYLQQYRRQPFVGPPETVREHVLFATEAVLAGRWKEACQSLLESLEVWSFIPGQGNANKVRQALQQRVQEEAVRCHLLQAADSYDAFSLKHLSETFDLPLSGNNSSGSGAQVRRIVCRMIFQRELQASLQTVAGGEEVLVFHRNEVSSLQTAAIAASEKLVALQDSNERVLDNCVGNLYNFKDDWKNDGKKQQDGGYKNQGDNRGNYRGHGGRGGAQNRGPRPVVPSRAGGGRGGGRGGAGNRGTKKTWAGGANSNNNSSQNAQNVTASSKA